MLVGLATTPAPVEAQAKPKPCKGPNNSVHQVLDCVTLGGVLEHADALQAIADAHGGNRAVGTPGYDASADYVEALLAQAGYVVTRQTFEVPIFKELGPSVLEQIGPNSVTYQEGTEFHATDHSEEGDVTADVTPVDIQLGLGNTSTSGCEADDFADFPAGDIALIQRGTCFFSEKADNADAAGASGVLFFNQGNTTDPSRHDVPPTTLGQEYTGDIPALSSTYALGAELAGVPDLELRLFANVSRISTATDNVIAESRMGDRRKVVMAGAHLDSVPEGPGINDDGSGATALLEVAEQLARTHVKNRLRFVWWGSEETGLNGSMHYVESLAASELADIEMYLNFDMVGSPNYGLFTFDGDGSAFDFAGPDGSDEIESLFEDFYSDRGVPIEPAEFDGRSDYLPFLSTKCRSADCSPEPRASRRRRRPRSGAARPASLMTLVTTRRVTPSTTSTTRLWPSTPTPLPM